MDTTFAFIKKNGGLTTSKDYPYEGVDGSCNKEKALHHAVNISGYERAPSKDEAMLKVAAANQPISVAIDAGGYAFQLYSQGVFSGVCGKKLNHGVTIVGMKRDAFDKAGTCGIAMKASYPLKD
ncbi:Vignain [Glycine max]|nr:Vignain [Glycine max]